MGRFDNRLRGLQKCYDEIVEDVHHPLYKMFVRWSLPKLEIMKLKGDGFRKLTE